MGDSQDPDRRDIIRSGLRGAGAAALIAAAAGAGVGLNEIKERQRMRKETQNRYLAGYGVGSEPFQRAFDTVLEDRERLFHRPKVALIEEVLNILYQRKDLPPPPTPDRRNPESVREAAHLLNVQECRYKEWAEKMADYVGAHEEHAANAGLREEALAAREHLPEAANTHLRALVQAVDRAAPAEEARTAERSLDDCLANMRSGNWGAVHGYVLQGRQTYLHAEPESLNGRLGKAFAVMEIATNEKYGQSLRTPKTPAMLPGH